MNDTNDLYVPPQPTRKFVVKGVVSAIKQGNMSLPADEFLPEPQGFAVFLGLLKCAHEQGIKVQVSPTGNDELMMHTEKEGICRNLIVCEQGYIEFFHLDNTDRRKSYSRVTTDLQDIDLNEVVKFLIL